jgi:type III secretion system FlhB-like substrate exporter
MNATEVRGRVVDETGAVIAGAQVQLQSHGEQKSTAVADTTGGFVLKTSSSSGTLQISARGFSSVALEWSQSSAPLTVTLKPSPVAETVIVTAERNATRIEETAANVAVLTPLELSSKAALTLDDVVPSQQQFDREPHNARRFSPRRGRKRCQQSAGT